MEKSKRFSGLKLTSRDRAELAKKAKEMRMSARTWRRIRILELLDEGLSVRATAEAAGTYPRQVSRVGKRYVSGGLQVALTDDPRGIAEKLLDSTQQAAVVAMVCGPPPDGRSRWTIRLLAEEVVRRGISPSVGRETVRIVLATHDLKPWREKNVVRSANRSGIRHEDGRHPAGLRPEA